MPPKKQPLPSPPLPTVTEGQVVAAGLRRQAADLLRWASKLEDDAMAGKEPVKRDRRKQEGAMAMVKRLRAERESKLPLGKS